MRKTGVIVAAALLATAWGANAAPITYTWNIDPDGGGPLNPLTATAVVDVQMVDATTYNVFVELLNSTSGYTNAGIASFGFGVEPDATGVTGTTTGDNDTLTDTDVFDGFSLASLPSLKLTEVCAWAGNNCAGGPQKDLLAQGQTDFFQMVLTFATAPTSVTLSNLGLKWQTNAGSFEAYNNGGGGGTGGGGFTGPEPATMLLLGTGLVAVARRLRRK